MKKAFVVLLFLAVSGSSLRAQENPEPAPLTLGPGPHLFIDDHLIGEQLFLQRTVNNPTKLPDPVIPGGDPYRISQPFVSVVRDAESGIFRMWYEVSAPDPDISHVAYTESKDGVTWPPPRILPNYFCDKEYTHACRLSVVDHGPGWPDASKRYVMAVDSQVRSGTRVAYVRIFTSADGLDWTLLTTKPALSHNNDITSLHWDPIRKQYIVIASQVIAGITGLARVPHQSESRDLINWSPKRKIIQPSLAPVEMYARKLNDGTTQFYGMSGIVIRGDLMIGLVKVLQDHLNATPGKSAAEMGSPGRAYAGFGYTVLAWSRDGQTWQRDHEPFIPRNRVPGTFDYAMSWGDSQIVTDEETLIYYAGYKRGHKVNRTKERQLGLARMPRDRYVCRLAGPNIGRLTTKPLVLKASSLTVNANVRGEARVRLLDTKRQRLDGFGWVELKGDSIEHKIEWNSGLTSLSGKVVYLEFQLRDAQLFGFDLQ